MKTLFLSLVLLLIGCGGNSPTDSDLILHYSPSDSLTGVSSSYYTLLSSSLSIEETNSSTSSSSEISSSSSTSSSSEILLSETISSSSEISSSSSIDTTSIFLFDVNKVSTLDFFKSTNVGDPPNYEIMANIMYNYYNYYNLSIYITNPMTTTAIDDYIIIAQISTQNSLPIDAYRIQQNTYRIVVRKEAVSVDINNNAQLQFSQTEIINGTTYKILKNFILNEYVCFTYDPINDYWIGGAFEGTTDFMETCGNVNNFTYQ